MSNLGYTDPMTYKSLPTIAGTRLTNHIFDIEDLVQNNQNEYLHQYIYEISLGTDPRKSEWYKKLKGAR